MISSIQRRAHISKQLLDLGLAFSFFDAVIGANLEHPELDNYDDKNRLFKKGHSLTNGEKGCFASHKEIWVKCENSGKNYIVIEDDALISESLKDIYLLLPTLSDKYAYIRLGRGKCSRLYSVFPEFFKIEEINKINFVVKYLKPPSCTHGYFITPKAAKSFLKYSSTWWWPVDDYMDHEYIHNIPCIGVEPPVILQSDLPSEIGGVKNQQELFL